MHNDDLGGADERARAAWEDGEGFGCLTSSGYWHAAIAYERRRVAALQRPPGQTESAIAEQALKEFSAKCAPLHIPCFFWIGLPKTNESLFGGSGDMADTNRERLYLELREYLKKLPRE